MDTKIPCKPRETPKRVKSVPRINDFRLYCLLNFIRRRISTRRIPSQPLLLLLILHRCSLNILLLLVNRVSVQKIRVCLKISTPAISDPRRIPTSRVHQKKTLKTRILNLIPKFWIQKQKSKSDQAWNLIERKQIHYLLKILPRRVSPAWRVFDLDDQWRVCFFFFFFSEEGLN